jgi:ABC-2 type transport system permease protein
LIAGKLVGCLISSLLIVAIVLGFGALTFHFPIRGSFVGLFLIALTFAWTASAFGLMVAALGRSPQGARAVAVLGVLAMTMLGGGWIPGFLFPQWLQSITPAVPARWAIEGLDAVISKGYTLTECLPTVIALTAFGAAFAAAGLAAFRWAEPA